MGTEASENSDPFTAYGELFTAIIERQNLLIHAMTELTKRIDALEKNQSTFVESLNRMTALLMKQMEK